MSRIKALDRRCAPSETSVREAERQVATGEIAVKKAELTLCSWGVPEQVIENVKREVESIRNHQDIGKREDAEWARVDIKAPIEGTIVEKNITIGDIVDTTTDLFKIADLSVLTLWLHAYEEDLPYLERLPSPIPVRIRIPANPEIGELPAAVESIGDIINPLEHMAVLVGHVDNASGDLCVGNLSRPASYCLLTRAWSRSPPERWCKTAAKASCSCKKSPTNFASNRGASPWPASITTWSTFAAI